MTETWLPWCNRRPGPAWKRGYDGLIGVGLDSLEGEVKHSAEGPLSATLGVLDGDRQASWTWTVDTDGVAYQHYPIEIIAWHCGVKGDERQDTSLIGNVTLRGIEHIGVAGEPLTPPQLAATVRITQDLRRLCPRVAARPPTLRGNLWEHGWLSQTSCPSGRIPWPAIIASLNPQEDDMTDLQAQQLARLYNWFFEPAGFVDPLGRGAAGPQNRAEWLNALFSSMDTWEHFQGIRTRLAHAGNALAK